MKFRINKLSLVLILLTFSIVHSQESNDEVKNKDNIDKDTQHPLLSNRFTLYAGAYSSTKNLKVKVNGFKENDFIDLSENFDFNENEITLFLNFNWRFARMWTLSAEYFSIKNGISKDIDGNIEWEDEIYNGGGGIKFGLNIRMYRLMFGRTIIKGKKYELGAGLGAHLLDFETYIEGYAYINNEETGEGADVDFLKKTIAAVAPLPNIGAWYFYAPNDKWMLNARVDWLAISINEYRGNMWNLGTGVDYQFHKNFGVGLKYRYFDFTSKIDNKDWDGEFSFIFSGPLLTINANF